MPRLSSFVYCLSIDKPNGGQGPASARGLLSMLRPQFIPGAFSFSIAFSIMGLGEEPEDTTVRIVFHKRGEQEALVDSAPIAIPREILNARDKNIPDDFQGMDLTMDIRNVPFHTEGIYETDVYLNGELLDSAPIYVKGEEHLE